MTDKQIIIDGVDVRGCEFYESNGMCSCSLVYYDYCKDFPNCVYKLSQKLKAKEQECETLASQLDFEVQKKECLEQECEEWKNKLAKSFADERKKEIIIDLLKTENEKLKQTLTEIKEIAERVKGYDPLAKQILQICDEVENENTAH